MLLLEDLVTGWEYSTMTSAPSYALQMSLFVLGLGRRSSIDEYDEYPCQAEAGLHQQGLRQQLHLIISIVSLSWCPTAPQPFPLP